MIIYTVNETGLAEIREYLERFSKHEPTNQAVHAYAADAEQDLNDTCGVASSMEIRASNSKSGNPLPFDLSSSGWDEHEEDDA